MTWHVHGPKFYWAAFNFTTLHMQCPLKLSRLGEMIIRGGAVDEQKKREHILDKHKQPQFNFGHIMKVVNFSVFSACVWTLLQHINVHSLRHAIYTIFSNSNQRCSSAGGASKKSFFLLFLLMSSSSTIFWGAVKVQQKLKFASSRNYIW